MSIFSDFDLGVHMGNFKVAFEGASDGSEGSEEF